MNIRPPEPRMPPRPNTPQPDWMNDPKLGSPPNPSPWARFGNWLFDRLTRR